VNKIKVLQRIIFNVFWLFSMDIINVLLMWIFHLSLCYKYLLFFLLDLLSLSSFVNIPFLYRKKNISDWFIISSVVHRLHIKQDGTRPSILSLYVLVQTNYVLDEQEGICFKMYGICDCYFKSTGISWIIILNYAYTCSICLNYYLQLIYSIVHNGRNLTHRTQRKILREYIKISYVHENKNLQ